MAVEEPKNVTWKTWKWLFSLVPFQDDVVFVAHGMLSD